MNSSIKTLLRKFKLNPTAMQSIKVEFRERTSEANLMIEQLNQLQDVLFSRLVTSPNEEIERHKLTVQMMTREKKARMLIKKLEHELKQEKSSKDGLVRLNFIILLYFCLLYTSPSPRDGLLSRMPSSA